MELCLTKKDDTLILNLEGESKIYILNYEQFENELNWCNTITHKKLILDFSTIQFIDTSGFRFLLQLNKKYNESGKELFLSNVTVEAEELLELVKVNEIFKRYNLRKKSEISAA